MIFLNISIYLIIGGGRELGTQGVPTSNLNTFLTCRTVRIGSYKYVPNDKIILSTDGLKLDVPLLEDGRSYSQIIL